MPGDVVYETFTDKSEWPIAEDEDEGYEEFFKSDLLTTAWNNL